MIGRCALILAFGSCCSPASADMPFKFENETSLSDMQDLVRKDVPVGSSRQNVRDLFIGEGGATLKLHPVHVGVEKYIYDINLCSYYVWRWNISADYDALGKLMQLYINGEPALPNGSPLRTTPKGLPDQKAAILKIARPRPEAYKGETSLAALVLDRDANPNTTDDQELVGAGPTRSDPLNMGTMHIYRVEPWRSIFDMTNARTIVSYSGNCATADAAFAARAKPH